MINGTKVKIRPKLLEDADNDYRWQVDAELSDLDAVPPLRLAFDDYLEDYRDVLRHPTPSRRNFAVTTLDGKHIGNCVYYNIDNTSHEAEIGIMIGDRDYWDKGYGTDTITVLADYVFKHHNFKRIYLKTLEKNLRAQSCFRKCGFTPCGTLVRDSYSFMLMELPRTRWQTLRARNKKARHLFDFSGRL